MPLAEPEKEPTIKDLYFELNEDRLKEAEEILDKYVAVALRMCERMRMGGAMSLD